MPGAAAAHHVWPGQSVRPRFWNPTGLTGGASTASQSAWLRRNPHECFCTPRERILSLFDVLARQVQPENCRGCPFLMALAEFPDAQSPVHVAAAAPKAWVRRRLHDLTRELAEETPLTDPAALADQLALVVEGFYASVQALTAAGPAMLARATAEALIDAAHQ